MQKQSIKKIISVILLLTVLITIFILSAMNANDSASNSRNILKNIISINFIKNNIKKTDTYKNIEKKVDNSNISEDDKEDIILGKIAKKYDETFRESMHTCEYIVLSFVTLIAFKQFKLKGKKIFIFSMLFCFIYACTDEFHQIFVEGRGCELLDIKLDILGIIIGAVIYGIYRKISRLCFSNDI